MEFDPNCQKLVILYQVCDFGQKDQQRWLLWPFICWDIIGLDLHDNNRFYHNVVEGTRESHLSVHDLQSTTRNARCGDWLFFFNAFLFNKNKFHFHYIWAIQRAKSLQRHYFIIYLALNNGAKISHDTSIMQIYEMNFALCVLLVCWWRVRLLLPRSANIGYISVSSRRTKCWHHDGHLLLNTPKHIHSWCCTAQDCILVISGWSYSTIFVNETIG